MHDVEHHRYRRSPGQQRARDGNRLPVRLEPERLAGLPADRPLLDLDVLGAEREPAAGSDRRVGLEPLEPLPERGRHRHPADERAAPLTAHDLAALLQALKRAAQRPA